MARLLLILLVVALIAAIFAQESDAGQLEGRGYFGRPYYGGYGSYGYGGYGPGYGGYGLANGGYFNPYGYGAGHGYALGFRSGQQPAEGEAAPVEEPAPVSSN